MDIDLFIFGILMLLGGIIGNIVMILNWKRPKPESLHKIGWHDITYFCIFLLLGGMCIYFSTRR